LQLQLGPHRIDCTRRTAIMAILNVSHDSPVAPSIVDPSRALDRARELRRAGAEIIDVGAHSTSSAARDITPQEEIERVAPVVEALARDGLAVSVDTWTPEVAAAAAGAGAHLLNDVTGFTNPAMVAVAVERRLPVVVMHMRGEPKRHYEADQRYDDVAAEVRDFLVERAAVLEQAGTGQVWLDPGFGFGKSMADNMRLAAGLPGLVASGRPVLVSASRKGFLAEALGRGNRQDAPGLLEATVAFNSIAAWMGVHVVRVHDVAEIADALRVVNAIRALAPE
jgi:dihydropteroate synthase